MSLGFTELVNRANRYAYKGVSGRLQADTGVFYFHGFNPPIEQVADLKYMLMLIDYHQQATFVPFPTHYN